MTAAASQQRRSSVDLMRVLHAYKVYRPDIQGGIPAVISSLAEDRTVAHSVQCARLFGLSRDYEDEGTPVHATSSLGTLFSTPVAPSYIPALCRRMKQQDIVVHHAPFPLNDAAILIGLPADVALVVYWHADVLSYPLLRRLVSPMTRRVLERADTIVVSGQALIDGSDLLRPHAAKCAVLPYGIGLEYWRRLDATELANVAKMQRDRRRHIVAVGRLVGYKGFHILINALETINAHVTVVGEGPLKAALEQHAVKMGVSHKIEFVGSQSRSYIKTLFHAAQVMALPSVTEAEAFGIVQIEAMATGLPIVNTSLPTTVPTVARHEQEALTVAPNDAPALAAALNRILDEPCLQARLGAAASMRASAEFDDGIFHDRMIMIYRRAMNRPGSAS